MPDEFDSLLEGSRLQDELRRAADAIGTLSCAGIALSIAGRRRIAYARRDEGTGGAVETSQAAMPMGCLMKLLTATLIAQAVHAGTLDWDSPIGEIAGLRLPPTSFLSRAVTLRHLLSHSHGWDQTAISAVPRCPDGRIDVLGLFRALGSAPLVAHAGRYYNYGNAGAWVCGAVLEQVSGVSYKRVLSEHLLAPLGCDCRLIDSIEPCPAMDFNVALPLEAALQFLELHLSSDGRHHEGCSRYSAFSPEDLRSWSLPLPGWSPSERRICLGWKSYGSDWYGHNALLPRYSAVMRISPQRKIACVFFGKGERALSVFARVFARRLPEFFDFRLPKMLDREQVSHLDLAAYEATFECSNSWIAVERTVDHRLQYRMVSSISASQPSFAPGPLLPASDHMFVPGDPVRARPELPFLQFLRATSASEFDYLWNGMNLWRRSRG